MQITNKHNIPAEVVNYLQRNRYNPGDSNITVSQLIRAPRQSILAKRHWHEIVRDISEEIPSLLGTALHKIFEEGAEHEATHISEERLFVKLNGWIVSGQIDTQIVKDKITIRDYKSTSAWAVMHEKKEWELQTNLYAYLVEKVKEKPVDSVEIMALVRDWNRREAARNPDYPQCMIVTVKPPLWPMEERERYLLERLEAHASAEAHFLTDENPGLCTPEDQWRKPPSFAVMKKDAARAMKVFEIKEEAEAFAADKKGVSVITRPAEATRCMSFCNVAPFCSQWKEENEIR